MLLRLRRLAGPGSPGPGCCPYSSVAWVLPTVVLLAWLAVTLAAPQAWAQKVTLGEEAYLQPPQVIKDSVTAAWHKNITFSEMSPRGDAFLVDESVNAPPLSRVGRHFVRLGEMAIDALGHRSRTLSVTRTTGYVLYDAEGKQPKRLKTPPQAVVSGATWSPSGRQLAFMVHLHQGSFVYVADVRTGETRPLTNRPLLATHVTSLYWTRSEQSLIAVFRPEGATPPVRPAVAPEPKVRLTRDGKTPSRTYRFLLDSPYEKELLKYYSTGVLARVNVANGQLEEIGQPRMITSLDPDPHGRYFRIRTLSEPFTYYDTASRFGYVESVIDQSGRELIKLSERQLSDNSRSNGRPETNPKRSLEWRPDGRGLSFLQRMPKPEKKADDADADPKSGEAASESEQDPGRRTGNGASTSDRDEPGQPDRILLWKPPFRDTDVEEVLVSEQTISGVTYTADNKFMFVTRTIKGARSIHAIPLADTSHQHLIYERKGSSNAASTRRREGPADSHIVSESGEVQDPGVVSTSDAQQADPGSQQAGPDAKGQAQPSQAQPSQGQDPATSQGKQKQKRKRKRRRGKKDPQAQDAPAADKQDDAKKDDAKQDDAKQDEPPKRDVAQQGTLLTRRFMGVTVVRMSRQGHVYFSGDTSSEEADSGGDSADGQSAPGKLYLDRLDVKAGKLERVYQSDGQFQEGLSAVANDELRTVYVTREKPDVVPDTYHIDVRTGQATKLTSNRNYTPWYNRLQVDRFQVQRADGFKFWVTVRKNPEYGQKLPAMFWFYPREYTSQEAYDRGANRTRGAFRFQRPSSRSVSHLTQLGYVIVEPDMPIVGPENRMNDNYIPDLRNGLWAVIQECDKRGYLDTTRMAIGGHSYGAFSTANAMIHTPFFRAGIAGDGNYNRTLTPMGFQRERRILWEGREVYFRMSPMFWADQLTGALLMYHGMDDNNTGTFPVNSERMYHALDGLGKKASLYMYPYEGHSPIADESVLDLWARWVGWLEHYVKYPEQATQESGQTSEASE